MYPQDSEGPFPEPPRGSREASELHPPLEDRSGAGTLERDGGKTVGRTGLVLLGPIIALPGAVKGAQ